MTWLTNIYNPNLPDSYSKGWQTKEAWENHLKSLQGKVIGPPKPSQHLSVEQLQAINIVGVYKW